MGTEGSKVSGILGGSVASRYLVFSRCGEGPIDEACVSEEPEVVVELTPSAACSELVGCGEVVEPGSSGGGIESGNRSAGSDSGCSGPNQPSWRPRTYSFHVCRPMTISPLTPSMAVRLLAAVCLRRCLRLIKYRAGSRSCC